MILVDTSVWVDHFRRGDTQLADLLERGLVLMHPWVLGEIACGDLSNRFCRNSAMNPSMAARLTPFRKPASRTGSLQTLLGL